MDLSDPKDLASLLEAFLLASGKPLSLERLGELFEEHERPSSAQLKKALEVLDKSCKGRAFELKEVASGYRLQVRQRFSPWVGRLWEERPQRYSRALLETLALIAYRQPITRGEIEDIRGVAVNSQIVKTLQEREWIRVVGHRDVPGRPAMFATTRQFRPATLHSASARLHVAAVGNAKLQELINGDAPVTIAVQLFEDKMQRLPSAFQLLLQLRICS